MSLLKRLNVTLRATLDRAVGEIEDHDAVVEAGLDELREAIAKLQVERAQVDRSARQLDQDIDHSERQAERWRARAQVIATGNTADDGPRQAAPDTSGPVRGDDSSEARALECLRRQHSERERGRQLRARRDTARTSRQRLDDALAKLHARLRERETERDALRVRDVHANPDSTLTRMDRDLGIDLDRALRRWDVDVTRNELRHGTYADDTTTLPTHPGDAFENAFNRAEEDAALRRELAALKGDA